MSSSINYRVDVVKATPDNKYTVPCGKNSIVALSGRPITKQTWSIPKGHVAIYSTLSITKHEYQVTRTVRAPSAAAPAVRDTATSSINCHKSHPAVRVKTVRDMSTK